MTSSDLKTLVTATFRDPASAAGWLIGLGLPLPVRWMALILAVSVSALLAWLSTQLFPMPAGEGVPLYDLTRQPLVLAGIQLLAILLAAGLMAGVGRAFGGKGSFEDALLLTVWIEIVLLLVQAAQIVLSLALPGLAGILGLVAIVLFLWLTVQFAKALHGFQSGLKVFLVLILTAFLAGFVLSFVAAAFGLFPETMS